MSMKKSVVLGALMAFVIAGNVSAAELNADETQYYNDLQKLGELVDLNNDGSIDINDFNIVKQKVEDAGLKVDKESLQQAATELKQLFSGNGNGANVTEIKNAFSNFLKNLDSGDLAAIEKAAQDFINKIPADQQEAIKGLIKDVIASGSDATGALGSIGSINDSLGKLVDFTKKMEQTLANATAKAEQLAGSIEKNLTKVDQKIVEGLQKVDNRIENFESNIGSRLDNIDTQIAKNVAAVEEKLAANLKEVAGKVAQNAAEVDKKIKENVDKYKGEIKENIGEVAGNVDSIVDNVKDYAATNGVEHAEMQGDIATNKADIATNKADIAQNKADIAQNKTDIATNKADIATNKADIATNKADIATNKADIATNKADIATNKADIATNKADIATNKADIATNKADIATNKADIAANKADIAQNKEDIENEKAERVLEDALIRQEMQEKAGRLDNRITRLEDRVDKVGAMAAAMASLKTMGYDPEAPTEIAVGVGQYSDQTGMALGAFHYPNRDFMLNFNVSTAGDEVMGGMGATWKLGRKKAQGNSLEVKLAKAEALKAAAVAARAAK